MPKIDADFDPAGYATVADRIVLFYQSHPNGRIVTELVTRDAESVTFKALVFRNETDSVPAATGWATEREGDGDINTIACLENTETSAIGRALANLGFAASRFRPSVEEMRKAARARAWRAKTAEELQDKNDSGATDSSPNAVADLTRLLTEAERAGLGGERTRKLRQRLRDGPPLPLDRIVQIERALRAWLQRRPNRPPTRLPANATEPKGDSVTSQRPTI